MFTYQGVDIFYERRGTGLTPVLLLHGWGVSGKTLNGLFCALSDKGMDAVLPDFPGFGNSAFPPVDAGLEFYADAMESLMAHLGFEKFDVVAHSFGVRVAIILAKRGRVNRLVIMDGAGLKPKFSFKKWLKIKVFKLKKRLGLSVKNSGSADYKALNEYMRPVFVRVVNAHLDGILGEIKCETLILWGKDDRDTPPYMARRFRKGIPDSEIVWLEGGHFAYIEDGFTAKKVTEAFLCR